MHTYFMQRCLRSIIYAKGGMDHIIHVIKCTENRERHDCCDCKIYLMVP